jgi:predicted ATP-grasp superfamily ATP-dependent carboligase
MKKNNCALILGGNVNGYSIIQELHEKNVEEIILFGSPREFAAHSNKIKKFVPIDSTPESLHQEIKKLHEEYEKIIVFPTNDLQLENLHKLHNVINSFCFLPFNPDNLLLCLDKYIQYSYCEKLGVPYPKTLHIQEKRDLEKIGLMQFPILLKPTQREDQKKKSRVFRNMKIAKPEEFTKIKNQMESYLDSGIKFLASEIIPGDENCIFAYVAYRDMQGRILNDWTGKKLAQYPNSFGVFSSASNEAPEEVRTLGRILLNGMDIKGIAEPEFKYDSRDKKYKLMEINLRSMMWNRVGNLSGVSLQYTQYLDALGKTVDPQVQVKDKDIHFIYLNHEIINLLFRKNYFPIFRKNIWDSDESHFAVFDKGDMKPFLKDIIGLPRMIFRRFMKASGILQTLQKIIEHITGRPKKHKWLNKDPQFK